jgi:predicted nucleotidyltransferase
MECVGAGCTENVGASQRKNWEATRIECTVFQDARRFIYSGYAEIETVRPKKLVGKMV